MRERITSQHDHIVRVRVFVASDDPKALEEVRAVVQEIFPNVKPAVMAMARCCLGG